MESKIQTVNENIRQIEDIIDIQKANGGFSAGQVAISLPEESGECGGEAGRGQGKERDAGGALRPSDSDVTVLRLQRAGAGDVLAGARLADASSMINLATLVLQSPPPSKHNVAQELLLPLSSWERAPPAQHPPYNDTGTKKSRLARFLRLYFCPCCSCLYEMEKSTREDQSVYCNTHRVLRTTNNTD